MLLKKRTLAMTFNQISIIFAGNANHMEDDSQDYLMKK